ncbi:MAG: alpha/beta hydrolase [bacterium]|nr:alpha/beta hydrolase [bacterium]
MKTIQSHFKKALSLAFLILQATLMLSCSEQTSTPSVQPTQPKPFESGYAEINSVRLYYEITGEGEPMLLLHGGLGGSDYFKGMIPRLSESFRVITVDRRGHGRSYDTTEPYSYAAMADDIKTFLDHLHIDSADVLGFSDGGVVGYHLASTHPQTVKKLVAVGANYRVDGMTKEAVDWAMNQVTPESLPEIESAYKAANPQPDNYPEFIKKSQTLWLRDPYLTEEQMRGIQSPVLFMIGEQDVIRIEHVLEMRYLVQDSQLCVLPSATHFVLSERPDVVMPILLDFFQN